MNSSPDNGLKVQFGSGFIQFEMPAYILFIVRF